MSHTAAIIETDIPARLDRLPWTGFHTLVVVALGITWVLDGLEVTVAGSIAGALQESPVLRFTAEEIGLVGSAYLAGAITGAVLFGYLTDRFGRKKLFMVTLGIYLTATAATAFSWDFWSFAAFRFLTGAGIGGEYTAINSAIQELIPARFRGRTDLAINGSFWLGAALGAGGAIVFLHPGVLPEDWGWRAAFGIGAVLGLDHYPIAPIHSRKSALADPPRPPRWRRKGRRRDRAPGHARRRRRTAGTARRAPSARREFSHTDGAHGAGDRARLSATGHSRSRPDGLAGILLQCDLLFVRARADEIL